MYYFNWQVDLVDKDVLELVEIETMELLEKYGFDGENTPFVYGSALLALQVNGVFNIRSL